MLNASIFKSVWFLVKNIHIIYGKRWKFFYFLSLYIYLLKRNKSASGFHSKSMTRLFQNLKTLIQIKLIPPRHIIMQQTVNTYSLYFILFDRKNSITVQGDSIDWLWRSSWKYSFDIIEIEIPSVISPETNTLNYSQVQLTSRKGSSNKDFTTLNFYFERIFEWTT